MQASKLLRTLVVTALVSVGGCHCNEYSSPEEAGPFAPEVGAVTNESTTVVAAVDLGSLPAVARREVA